MIEHKPFSNQPFEHGVSIEVNKDQSQQVLDLLDIIPMDYGELREKTGFDDSLLNSVLNLLNNHNLIERDNDKWKSTKI